MKLHKMIASSPNKNLLWRIFDEKTRLRPDQIEEKQIVENERCLVPRDPKIVALLKTDAFVVGDRKMVDTFVETSLLFEKM